MRKITVDVIASENFDIVPQGYNQKQVDDFLNEICDYLEFGLGQGTQQNDAAKDAEINRLNMEKNQLESRIASLMNNKSNQMELDSKDAEIQKLNIEIGRLQGLVKAAQQESAEARAKLEMAPKNEMEATSERATMLLLNAQKLYDSTVEQAKEEAKEIKEKAQQQADAQLGSIKQEKESLEEELLDVQSKFESYINNLEEMLKAQQDLIASSKEKL